MDYTQNFSQLTKEANDVIGPSQTLLQTGRYTAQQIIDMINASLEKHPDFSPIR